MEIRQRNQCGIFEKRMGPSRHWLADFFTSEQMYVNVGAERIYQ